MHVLLPQQILHSQHVFIVLLDWVTLRASASEDVFSPFEQYLLQTLMFWGNYDSISHILVDLESYVLGGEREGLVRVFVRLFLVNSPSLLKFIDHSSCFCKK
ncbi:hypothetical protein KIL84_010112 [Mauremys mutica]|uniref:Uncharacterized protein n=1 Tax=Mauremys mutica TaxID=74926 RepID=A0A9D3XLZ7_9SAUR|nr:hypothetical protein KIL84_010112 [Mauremys mutica]